MRSPEKRQKKRERKMAWLADMGAYFKPQGGGRQDKHNMNLTEDSL